jgi:hypothetical protein
VLLLGASVSALGIRSAWADDLPVENNVELQPLAAQIKRVVEALEILGQPLSLAEKARIDKAIELADQQAGVQALQAIIDPHCLIGIEINPESRVKAAPGPAPARLVQSGWSVFLVKVRNQAGVTAELEAKSPNAEPIYKRSSSSAEPKKSIRPADITERWLDLAMFRDRPLKRELSGLAVEYRIVQLYSRDSGKREAKLSFHVGQGTQDLGFRSDVDILFDCDPAVSVVLDVKDIDGRPTMASFVFRDRLGRVYPSPGRRLAPDFFFHPQIYRKSGESVPLPPGTYQVEYTRGPEYKTQTRTITVPRLTSHHETFQLDRWIHMAELNWFSGDHHVHAAGCAHYESPTEGVKPEDMWRHILGEDLDVGCVLSWGPCWYAQKQFFEGKIHPLSTSQYLMRYDVEVSGFPSSHAGHLCLLRLKEDDYPGTSRIDDWPSWDLPVLKWGKSQGGVVGFSHSGWGLKTSTDDIPTYEVPNFDGIGANEYVVDVVHDAVDFLSTVDTPAPWELNIWYHTLNCGFRTRISGETDFPCIYGDRVGLGRVYVNLEDDRLDFDRWCQGVKEGRSYVGDGRSHIINFRVGDRSLGEADSELKLAAPSTVSVRSRVAALLDPEPSDDGQAIRRRPLDQKPYWHIERARIGQTRKVPVELIVNAYAVAKAEIDADGAFQEVAFELPIKKSSWVALRILPSSHTNPVFVVVAGKPIRASRKSADWCLKGIDQCWSQKEHATRASEKEDAAKAYELARQSYRKIRDESADE